MININDFVIDLDLNNSSSELNEIYQNLNILFSTPEGTVVFDRGFGIDWSIADLPLQQAKGALTIEYIEKVKKYEPRVKISQVSFKSNGLDGSLKPKVVIEIVN